MKGKFRWRSLIFLIYIVSALIYTSTKILLFLIAAPRGKGNVVLFPSYMVHSVKPVTKGTRKSFVLWLGGGHYK